MQPPPSGLSADSIAAISAVTLATGLAASYGIYRATRREPPAAANKAQAHQTVRETPISSGDLEKSSLATLIEHEKSPDFDDSVLFSRPPSNPQRPSEGEGDPSLVPDANVTSPTTSAATPYIGKATPVRQNHETLGDPSEEVKDYREVRAHDGEQDEALDDGERVDFANADLTPPRWGNLIRPQVPENPIADPVTNLPIMPRFGEADFVDEALGDMDENIEGRLAAAPDAHRHDHPGERDKEWDLAQAVQPRWGWEALRRNEPANIDPQGSANHMADPVEDLPATQHRGNDGPTLTTLPDELLQNVFSHIWDKNKTMLKLVNKIIASAAYDYERSMFFKHTDRLSETCKIPRDEFNTRPNWNTVYEHKTAAIENIPHLSGNKNIDNMVERRINDLVDLCIKENVRANMKKDLDNISHRLKNLGYKVEFVDEKLYLHDLSVFINYVKNAWNDHYTRHLLPSFRDTHIFVYLRSMSPKLSNISVSELGEEETKKTIAEELLQRIPSHFTAIEKAEALDRLEDAFKTHYSTAFYNGQNWEDTEFGISLRHARTANDMPKDRPHIAR